MTDRELLELSAKAAGYSYRWLQDGDRHLLRVCYEKEPKEGAFFDSMDWNPLTDDGDAFRLMVKLRMWQDCDDGICCVEDPADHGGDCFSAARRAIVRAAADFGKKMGDSQVERGFSPVTPQQFSDLCKTHWDQSRAGK